MCKSLTKSWHKFISINLVLLAKLIHKQILVFLECYQWVWFPLELVNRQECRHQWASNRHLGCLAAFLDSPLDFLLSVNRTLLIKELDSDYNLINSYIFTNQSSPLATRLEYLSRNYWIILLFIEVFLKSCSMDYPGSDYDSWLLDSGGRCELLYFGV